MNENDTSSCYSEQGYVRIPIWDLRHKIMRLKILRHFPECENAMSGFYLSLSKYIGNETPRFYSRNAKKLYTEFLNNAGISIIGIIESNLDSLNNAFKHLEEFNNKGLDNWIFDYSVQSHGKVFRENFLPLYQDLVGSVFYPLIRVIALEKRINRSVSTEGLDVYNCAQELSNTPECELVSSYNHLIRNAIVHGGVEFDHLEIKFKDKSRTLCLNYTEFVTLYDNLLDMCNGCALALRLFLIRKNEALRRKFTQLCIEEAKMFVALPWWSIRGYSLSRMAKQNQIAIVADVKTKNELRIIYSALLTLHVLLLQDITFERMIFEIHPKVGVKGMVIINLMALGSCTANSNDNVSNYSQALESCILFGSKKQNKLFSMIQNLFNSFIETYKYMSISMVTVRHFSIITCECHKSGSWKVVTASIAINGLSHAELMAYVRTKSRKMIKQVIAQSKKKTRITEILRYRPTALVFIHVFNSGMRPRQANSYGLGEKLVCTIRFQVLSRYTFPDILASEIEQIGRTRIAWNKDWLITKANPS